MPLDHTITTVEMHTAGEPFRIVTSGIPRPPGARIVDRRAWLQANADHLRRALIMEPRGHADMYAGILTEPVSPCADLGIIFAHNEGYSDHCGHGIIALATAAVQLGWVNRSVPETRVGIDAPCGFIEAFVVWDGERAGAVRFINVPSFLLARDVAVETPSFGRVVGDIAYGGAFYFYTPGAPHNLSIVEADLERLVRFGAEVKAAANAAHPVCHPDIPEINHIYGTIIDGKPRNPGSSQSNCCIFADREIDRSPTGSGTAGRVAQLHARGRLAPGAALINDSIIGSVFCGRVVGTAQVGPHAAVIPEISGQAYLCGFATWTLDRRDPLRHGFLLR
ncbi:MAG TPA: trans-3-hydroxy-L-proline dehydratase [Stellaceae bacterium]|jgi:trans-L-3-hydroxyproline dehydratase|nr:trans-3-hydroxy-L-proline dehydratase [Stellaceae bacterium]